MLILRGRQVPPQARLSRTSSRAVPPQAGQALIEYLLMTSMLLFLFTTLYGVLQSELGKSFEKIGRAILYSYY